MSLEPTYLGFFVFGVLVITPLGGIFGHLGKSVMLFSAPAAYATGGIVILVMALQLFGVYHLPVHEIFMRLRLPVSMNPVGTFLLDRTLGLILIFAAVYFFYLATR